MTAFEVSARTFSRTPAFKDGVHASGAQLCSFCAATFRNITNEFSYHVLIAAKQRQRARPD